MLFNVLLRYFWRNYRKVLTYSEPSQVLLEQKGGYNHVPSSVCYYANRSFFTD